MVNEKYKFTIEIGLDFSDRSLLEAGVEALLTKIKQFVLYKEIIMHGEQKDQ